MHVHHVGAEASDRPRERRGRVALLHTTWPGTIGAFHDRHLRDVVVEALEPFDGVAAGDERRVLLIDDAVFASGRRRSVPVVRDEDPHAFATLRTFRTKVSPGVARSDAATARSST